MGEGKHRILCSWSTSVCVVLHSEGYVTNLQSCNVPGNVLLASEYEATDIDDQTLFDSAVVEGNCIL